MKMHVIPAPEVAYLLRKELGPIRNWEDTLADFRRERTKVHGYTLLPKCMGKSAGTWRPMYAVPEVLAFIEAVRAADPSATRNEPPQIKTAITDPTDFRPWKMRKLPVATSAFAASM